MKMAFQTKYLWLFCFPSENNHLYFLTPKVFIKIEKLIKCDAFFIETMCFFFIDLVRNNIRSCTLLETNVN